MGVRLQRSVQKKALADVNRLYGNGFSKKDLPTGRDGRVLPQYDSRKAGAHRSSMNIAKYLDGAGGQKIRNDQKEKYKNMRTQLMEDRISDPLRTKTYTVNQGENSKTFRDPVKNYTVGQEILSNINAAKRGTGMSSSSKLGGLSAQDAMTEYGRRAPLIGASPGRSVQKNGGFEIINSAPPVVTNLAATPIDFSRRIVQ